MQPLIAPVDHESRHNSHITEDIREATLTEDTPLLLRFPVVQSSTRNPRTTIVVTLLLIILLSGIVIGIYLLIIQSRSENVLPPVDRPLQLVTRGQWDPTGSALRVLTMPYVKAKRVIVMQTGTRQCRSTKSCIELLHDMTNTTAGNNTLPYNFLVSSNGETYEALGWRRQSPLFPQHNSSIVLAFIGNFTTVAPTNEQMDEAKNLFAESVSHQYLEPLYRIYGGKTDSDANGLFSTMQQVPHWASII